MRKKNETIKNHPDENRDPRAPEYDSTHLDPGFRRGGLRKDVLKIFLLGCLAGVGLWAVSYVKFCSFIAFPLFLWMSGKHAYSKFHQFLWPWLFAWGYFVFSLYWIVVALHVDLEKFWWLIPFSVLGLPAVLASFFGVASLIIPWMKFKGISKVFFLACAWILAEVARSYLFTGFPWALLGYVWENTLPIAQLASGVGIFGLSMITIFWMGCPYAWVTSPKKLGAILYTALCILTFGLAYYWGGLRLFEYKALPHQNISMRLVQPNIPQTLKWDPQHEYQHLTNMMRLSLKNQREDLRVVLWPEAAVTFRMTPEVMTHVSKIILDPGYLITGGIRYQDHTIWSSIFAIDSKGIAQGIYDKHHLVPFGEYIPFRKILDQLSPGMVTKLSHGIYDYSGGVGPKYMDVPGIPPFIPLICYEVIFPGQISNPRDPRATWILNITNDAWFGNTAGPRQHLAMAKFRAIEEGLPLVRVANTGVSAVITLGGEILQHLDFETAGVLDFNLPGFISDTPLFSKHKMYFFYVLILFLVFSAIISHILCYRRKK